MAKRLAIPSKEVELVVVGPFDQFKASRVQRLGLNTTIPNTTVDELGDSNHVGDVNDTPNVTLTFSAFQIGTSIFACLTGTDPNAYPAIGVDISHLGQIDAIIYVKDPDLAVYAKSAHAHKLQIQNFTFNYTVDGEANEDYTAIGSTRRWLKYDVVVDRDFAGVPKTAFTLSHGQITLNNGNQCLSVIADGEYLTENTTTPAAPGPGEYGVVGTTLKTGDSVSIGLIAIYHSNPGHAWSDVSDLGAIAVKGRDVGITIATNDIPRVQSVTINGNLNIQPVREMGNREIAGYQRQVPTVDGTITVLDTDTELISLLTYGVLGSGVEWMPGGGCAISGVSLKVELYDPCDITMPYEVLKTIYIPQLSIVGDAFTSNVNNNATQTWNWKSANALCLVFSGAM